MTDDDAPAGGGRVIWQLIARAAELTKQDRPDEAVATYAELTERFGDALDPAPRVRLVRGLAEAWAELAKRGRHQEARDQLIRRFATSEDPDVAALVGTAGGIKPARSDGP